MKTVKVVFKTKLKQYWSICPHCGNAQKLGVWAIAHQAEADLVFECPKCHKKSQAPRRCCDLADKVDE